MYIYSKKTNFALKQLSSDNIMATIFEVIGIYQNFRKKNPEGTYDEFEEFYYNVRSGQIYSFRHYRNKGEKEIKSMLAKANIDIPRRAFRRIASTRKHFSVKTHILSGEIYKYTLTYLFENKYIKKLIIEELANDSTADNFMMPRMPKILLNFQYDSISEYLGLTINLKKKKIAKNIMNIWEKDSNNCLLSNEINMILRLKNGAQGDDTLNKEDKKLIAIDELEDKHE